VFSCVPAKEVWQPVAAYNYSGGGGGGAISEGAVNELKARLIWVAVPPLGRPETDRLSRPRHKPTPRATYSMYSYLGT